MTYEVSTIAQRIRTARVVRGMTQAELAVAIRLDVRNVSRWETGLGGPRASSVKRLTKALRIAPIWLLRGEGPMDTPLAVGED